MHRLHNPHKSQEVFAHYDYDDNDNDVLITTDNSKCVPQVNDFNGNKDRPVAFLIDVESN